MKITSVSFSFNISKKTKIWVFCPTEKVLTAKIDFHENEWVYCSKPHIECYNSAFGGKHEG